MIFCCRCFTKLEAEDSNTFWLSEKNKSNSPSRVSFEDQENVEAKMVNKASIFIDLPKDNITQVNESDKELLLSSDELIFYKSAKKTFTTPVVFETPHKRQHTDLNQLPLKAFNIISPEWAPQKSTAVDQAKPKDHHWEVQCLEEPSLSQEDSEAETAEIVSDISALTPSVIVREYSKEKRYPRVKARSFSLVNLRPEQLIVIRQRSSSAGERCSSESDPEEIQIETVSSVPFQENSEIFDVGTVDHTIKNSLYSSGSDSTWQGDNESVWATFVPLTPKRGGDSLSKTQGTSIRTSQLEFFELRKSIPKEEMQTKNKSHFTISSEVSGKQVDNINISYDSIMQGVIV